ncbi:unnamed protein product [Acanthoscelides obtectus]|uniref:Uncharacterized protein n=1 Tax=Acanthoscelides obtectus TaxID=200917 RepID=A0A9P0VNQ4_ACAOB|nr:unnamed protein product [Acanthoscelides obtectus]CAK1620498.1 Isthmin-1 [Acanthoscelides obtectus]
MYAKGLLLLVLIRALAGDAADNIDTSKKGLSLHAFLQSKLDAIREVVRIKNHAIRNHKANKSTSTTQKTTASAEDQDLAQLEQVLTNFLKARGNKGKRSKRDKGKQRVEKSNEQQKWDNWSPWSSCSVSCGKGRTIRWRHCLESCDGIETEMRERSCQLPACPQKLFGIIKL